MLVKGDHYAYAVDRAGIGAPPGVSLMRRQPVTHHILNTDIEVDDPDMELVEFEYLRGGAAEDFLGEVEGLSGGLLDDVMWAYDTA